MTADVTTRRTNSVTNATTVTAAKADVDASHEMCEVSVDVKSICMVTPDCIAQVA